jgi:hypothetical protein
VTTVTYRKQPAIHVTRGAVPLAGTSHVYTVSGILWPNAVEDFLKAQFVGTTLHCCCGKSKLGDVRLDLYEDDVDYKADAARLPFDDLSFDTYLADVPYNGVFQWMHDALNEAIRVTRKRIIWQHWFSPVNKDGFLKKAHVFKLRDVAIVPTLSVHADEMKVCLHDPETDTYYVAEEMDDDQKFALTHAVVWQPTAYFGRMQIISIFDRVPPVEVVDGHRQLSLDDFVESEK